MKYRGEEMESNYMGTCLALCGIQFEERHLIERKNKYIQMLNIINDAEDVRFDIYHKFFGDDLDKTTLEIGDLTLFETVKRLYELNENISSYEYYYALSKNS